MVDTLRSTKLADNSFSRAADRKNQYYSLLYSEMAERRRVEENLRRSNMLLQALSYAQLQYVGGTELAAVFDDLLRTLLEVTAATQGYLTESAYDAPSPHGPLLHLHIATHAELDPTDYIATIADYVLQHGYAVLVHPANPNNIPQLVGGNTSAYYLGMPIAIARAAPYGSARQTQIEKPVGAIVLCGHADSFDTTIVELMQPVVVTCAQLIIAQRNDQRRRAAESALADERALLAQRVAERTAELSYSNAELARAARAKDEFLATMNHELRTPLNAILLYADSLQLQLPGPLNERQMRAAVGIRESANHLLLLINDILDVAKMDAGKLRIDIKNISVENLCQGSLRLVSEMARKKGITLHYERTTEVDELDADERRLKQMVVNLLSNAIKFTPEGGKVGLEVGADAVANTVTLSVWDTGIGIAPADLQKLFQPFVQLDSSHVRQHGGTGLGLFLVKRMAELHGGTITTTSDVGKGSRFAITVPWHQPHTSPDDEIAPEKLPADDMFHGQTSVAAIGIDTSAVAYRGLSGRAQESLPTHAPHGSAHDTGTTSILIADDNEANVRVLSDFLQAWDCRVYVARTGRQAIHVTREVHPNLILMDIQMPEMNGLDAIRTIRAEPGLARTPIVALTALAMPGDREQCLAAGADDYVSKPIQIERLSEVLNRYLLRVPLEEES